MGGEPSLRRVKGEAVYVMRRAETMMDLVLISAADAAEGAGIWTDPQDLPAVTEEDE
jgi:hypothetical protein